MDFLDSLVEFANIFNFAALEPQNTRGRRSSTHVIYDVVFRLLAIGNTGEGTAGGVVQTDSQTITDKSLDPQTCQLSGQLQAALLLRGVEHRVGNDDIADIGALSSQRISIGLDLL